MIGQRKAITITVSKWRRLFVTISCRSESAYPSGAFACSHVQPSFRLFLPHNLEPPYNLGFRARVTRPACTGLVNPLLESPGLTGHLNKHSRALRRPTFTTGESLAFQLGKLQESPPNTFHADLATVPGFGYHITLNRAFSRRHDIRWKSSHLHVQC